MVTLRTEGRNHEKYKKLYPEMHEGMLWVVDVPGFEYILIHQGNTDDDTAGCLLVGEELVEVKGEWILRNSKGAYRRLYPLVAAALIAGDAVHITYHAPGT